MWDVPDMLEADLVLRQRAQAAQLAAKKSSKSLRGACFMLYTGSDPAVVV